MGLKGLERIGGIYGMEMGYTRVLWRTTLHVG